MPCYNTAVEHLREAVDSVLQYTGDYSYEIIIINDGSTNKDTLTLLEEFSKKNISVLHQQNGGPSNARNNGVNYSNAEFLLCLDSDNTINPAFIDEGIQALQRNSKAAVAYAKPAFAGDATRPEFTSCTFSIEKLFIENFIDMCSIIRRSAWQDVHGLDENLWQFEDWELWLHLYKQGWQFIFIDKILFTYRIRKNSLITQSQDAYRKTIAYLYQKHWDLLYNVFYQLYATSIIYRQDKQRPLRSFIKYFLKTSQS